MLYYAGSGDAVGLPARLPTVAGVSGVMLQLGEGGGRDPPYALALAPLLQKHAEVNPLRDHLLYPRTRRRC